MSFLSAAARIIREPPIRLIAKGAVRVLPFSARTKSLWDAANRPHYLAGTLYSAEQAREENVAEICVIEFGVAGGNGLLALQQHAAAVEKATGVRISVYGFDSGGGLPQFCGDYRDHPDRWKAGDYPLDKELLSRRLLPRTNLVLGDVRETVPRFVSETQRCPVGFISVDLDLYSSSASALQVLSLPGKRMLHRVPIYFDDVNLHVNHRFAGELLAIDEFNQGNHAVKIDCWRGLRSNRPFPEAPWLDGMYIAHDLAAISGVILHRTAVSLPIPD